MSLKRVCRRVLEKPWSAIGRLVEVRAARSGWWAVLYYSLFSRAFHREQQAFVAGRRRYHVDQGAPIGSAVLLRRNVHRLEKGLLMRPRRVPFARDYIEETVASFERACMGGPDGKCSRIDAGELKWARDVLQEYFSAMPESEDWLNSLRKRFLALLDGEQKKSDERYVPYRRNLGAGPSVAYDDLLELSWRRRSVRWFLQKPVERELIDKAVVVAGLAPSACNRQPFTFRVVDDPELLKKVVEIPFGLQGYGQNVPSIVVVVGRQRNYFDERDRHLIYIDGSLASMSFVYALETLGLSSCCVNWPDLADREARMTRVLELDADERPVMLVAVGYPDPDGMVAYSKKKPLEQLRVYNLEK